MATKAYEQLMAQLLADFKKTPIAPVILKQLEPLQKTFVAMLEPMKKFQEATLKIGEAFKSLGNDIRTGFEKLKLALPELVDKIINVTEALKNKANDIKDKIGKSISSLATGISANYLDPLKKRVSRAAASFGGSKVGQVFKKIGTRAASFAGSRIGQLGASIGGGAASSVAGFATKLASAAGPVGAALGGIASAGMAAVGAFSEMAGAAKQFVAVFSPSLVQALDLAMRDLYAVIGMALTPIIEVATQQLRNLANYVLPLARQLQPMIAAVASAFGELIGAVITQVAAFAQGLMPIIKLLSKAFSALLTIWSGGLSIGTAFIQIIGAILASLTGVLDSTGDGITSFANMVKSALQLVAKNLLIFAGLIAKFFGYNDFIKNLINNINNRKENAGGFAAAVNPTYKSFEQFGKDLALSASLATDTNGVKKPGTTEEWLEQAVKELEKVNGGQLDVQKAIKNAANEIMNLIGEKFAEKAYSSVAKPLGFLVNPGAVASAVLR